MLALGRALMARPQVLLLDEPSLGLAPTIIQDIARIIRQLASEGVTILLVEQQSRMALSLASYAYVLETGNIVLEGRGTELLHNDYVIKSYLGG
jgi:branched-chain amino acid transport system ATP-binding protein